MMRFAGVVLDGEDVLAGEGDVMSRLAPEALCEATQAGVVIWQGRIIKNRFVGLSSDTAEQNDPIQLVTASNDSKSQNG